MNADLDLDALAEIAEAGKQAWVALDLWRQAKGGSAAERRAARMMAYRLSVLLRELGLDQVAEVSK